MIIPGTLLSTGHLRFNLGKKCQFKMNTSLLREALDNRPLFIMFVDAVSSNVQMLGSSRVALREFGEEFWEEETVNRNVRRNYL